MSAHAAQESTVEPELQREFYDLTLRASAQLRAGAHVPDGSTSVLHVVRQSSFEDALAAELLERRAEGEPEHRILVTRWLRGVDADRMRDPVERLRHPRRLEPTFERIELCARPPDARRWRAWIDRIELPPAEPAPIVLDGTVIEVRAVVRGRVLRIAWNGSPPLVSSELSRLVDEFLSAATSSA